MKDNTSMRYDKLRLLIAVIAVTLFATARAASPEKVIVGYVTSWSDVIPDPTTMTHINYAFGNVNETFDGVGVANPERLRKIAALKKSEPGLKVALSVGGWGSGRFSEMASDAGRRRKFAEDCLRVVSEYGWTV